MKSSFDATGSLVSVGERDNTIRVRDTITGKLHAPVMHGTVPDFLEFTPDAKTLVTLGLNALRFWDVDTGLPLGADHPVAGTAFDFMITPDGKFVIVPNGDPTEVWSLPNANVSLEKMERATWRYTGSRLGPTGDFESIPASEIRSLSMP